MNYSRKRIWGLIYFVLLLGFLPVANAQTGRSISGKVLDENGEPLFNANVLIKNTVNGTNTNFKGEFSLDNIATSQFELLVTFIGYQQYLIPCNLNEINQPLKIKLTPISQEIEQVNVEGKAQGQTKAMLDQKLAENIKNIVSAEQIEKFPDLNAAEVMQRVTGVTIRRDQGEGRFVQLRGTPPEYTSFNINGEQIPSPEGDVRYVGMDIISSDQIESIEITKVLTPDMDGDAVAGSVNIKTKKAQSETPQLRISGAGGYNSQSGKGRYNAQFSFGIRKEKLGFQIDGSYAENRSTSENMEYEYIKGPFWGDTTSGRDNYHMMYKEVQMRYYEFTRKRTGLSATLDYNFNPNHMIYITGMYNKFSDDQTRNRMAYDLEDAANFYNYLYGSVETDVKHRTKNQQVNTVNIGAEHTFDFFKLDYQFAFAQAREATPNRITAGFKNPGHALAITLKPQDDGFAIPVFKDSEDNSIAHDYANYEFGGLEFRSDEIIDNNLSGKINFTIPWKTDGKETGYFKFGAKARLKHKTRNVTGQVFDDYNFQTNDRNRWDYIYPNTRPRDILVLTNISNGVLNDNLLNRGYVMEGVPDAQKMRDFYEYNAMFFKYDQADTKTRELIKALDYTANEQITAAYAMARKDFNRWMIQGGLRFENTQIDYEGKQVIENERSYLDTIISNTDSRSHTFILPQVNLKYSLNNSTNFRLAYTHSFMRPNFSDVLPIREEDDDGNIIDGNPNLTYPLAKNIDFMVEKYLSNNGILSLGLYYKRIDDFIARYTIYAHMDTIANSGVVRFNVPRNGKYADVFGAEIQAQFKFDFLPGFLSNFGVYSTYAYTYSDALINKRPPANYSDLILKKDEKNNIELFYHSTGESISLNGATEHIKLPGQARHSGNLALFYDNHKLYLKLTANYHDNFLVKLGADADLDTYTGEAWHLDFNGYYRINQTINIFADAVNLLNTPETSYIGNTNYILKQEYYSWWARIGVKITY